VQKYKSDVVVFTDSVPERHPCSSSSAGACTVTAESEGGGTHQNWDRWQVMPY